VIISRSDNLGEEVTMKVRDDLTRVELAILAALTSKERYGLEIIRTLDKMGQGLSLAGLYTSLARMEKQGLVKSRWGEEEVEARQGARRRYYEITGLGQKSFDQTKSILTRVLRFAPGAAGFAGEVA